MPELRWILLILGALLIAGLWWWELKRSRANSAPPPVEPEPLAERHEPKLGEYGAAALEDDEELPSIRVEERPVPRGDPPVLTIDDLPEDTDRVVLAPDAPEPRRLEPISARRDLPGTVVPEAISISATAGATGSASAATSTPPIHATRSETSAPPVRPATARVPAQTAPSGPSPTPPPTVAAVERPAVENSSSRETAAGAAASAPRPPAEAVGTESRRPAARPPGRTAAPAERLSEPRTAPSEPPSPLQKIIALRLVAANGERIDGGQLRAALEAEGMRFGKYSIFHRQRADGRAIYSAASLLEPGSFDLDRMESERYPGISMFAVFPGPIDAAEAFDELLATARRLADRLDAVPQDERGAPLGAQRALAIREELVHFQGLVNKTRSRPGG